MQLLIFLQVIIFSFDFFVALVWVWFYAEAKAVPVWEILRVSFLVPEATVDYLWALLPARAYMIVSEGLACS